jgi:hypothetical protein
MKEFFVHQLRSACKASLLTLLLLVPPIGQAQFTYITNNGSITITGYTGSGGVVIIPDTINDLPVTSIGDYAFYNNFNSPVSITIPNNVTNIGELAFCRCSSLTNVAIGNSVINIGDLAFGNCPSLATIAVDANNHAYSSVDGVLFNKSTNVLIQCGGGKTGNYTVLNSVTNIADFAFSFCSSLTSVTISDSVASFGDFAFDGCTSLGSVTIPNSVINIGQSAFGNCTNLSSVTIGNGVTNISDFMFSGCASLTSITIPKNVTTINDGAFYRCTSLTNITVPNSVTSIGVWAFEYCTSLVNVMIGNGVTSIGYGAFFGCYRLTSIYFKGNAPNADSTVFDGDNTTVYYLPGAKGWAGFTDNTGLPTMLWLPQVQTSDGSFGVRTNQFGFNIDWACDMVVVVEACTSITNPIWQPVQTNTFTSDSVYFSDPEWTNYLCRFYRVHLP